MVYRVINCRRLVSEIRDAEALSGERARSVSEIIETYSLRKLTVQLELANLQLIN